METERKVFDLNLDDVLPNRFQPRIKFDEEALNELADSIKEHGIIQPIVVRPIGDKYEIIAGERRYKASVIAGKTTIPAIITNLDDKESAEIALIENVQREDLTPIEEAVSYRKILDMGYLTQDELAEKLDRNQSTISNKLRLLNLDDEVQEALLNEKISERHARSLLKIEDKSKQREMLKKIINERLTVRKTDEAIANMQNNQNPPEAGQIEEIKIEEGENHMGNNAEDNIFNIPSEPIIEDIEMDDNNVESNEEAVTNPGFMDIDKIENQAQDINVERPVADMNNLLQSASVKNTNINNQSSDDNQEEDFDLKPGKFFTMGNEIEDSSPQENSNFTNVKVENNEEPLNQQKEPEENVSPIFNAAFGNVTEQTKELKTEPEEIDFNLDDDVPEVSKITEDSKAPELIRKEATPPGNLSNAITSIRSCIDNIQNQGYIIETEELDFEESYQVIVIINKNNK